ncbi:MAG: nicotinic acid mononucleotide adenylyltransferase, partial [Duncaniella sp.]|nr:nicotinic acid mononucleotide adenylyltransferase [Duncaniella sp.]
PRHSFRLIIGADNWRIFSQWKDSEKNIEEFGVTVYPRPGYNIPTIYDDNVDIVAAAPLAEISSTFLRKAIAKGKDMRFFLPFGVEDFIRENNLYK